MKLIFVIFIFLSGCAPSLCGSGVVKRENPFNETQLLVKVTKSCGATTMGTDSFYIVPERVADKISKNTPKLNNKYKIFSHTRGIVETDWNSGTFLTVRYDMSPRFGRSGEFEINSEEVGGVLISYEEAKLK